MTEEEHHRALKNCERIRRFKMPFLQVRPDPQFADNVHIRLRTGKWRVMHILDALASIKAAMRRHRIDRLGIRNAGAPGTRAALPEPGAAPPSPRR